MSFIDDDEGPLLEDENSSNDLTLVASELFSFSHKQSGSIVLDINRDILNTKISIVQKTLPQGLLTEKFCQWQERIRATSPSGKIFIPWGKV